ncbi:UDP-glycosyltransferase [Flavobacteriaceae bacterium TK19130]|nr:UDP-glycosyltransferase [Thermobacterium salinum]
MAEKKNTILFVVPDGVGARNYLFSKLPRLLSEEVQLSFLTTLTKPAIAEVEELHDIAINYLHFDLPAEPKKAKMYREAAVYARLLHNAEVLENETILQNWNKKKASFTKKIFYGIVERMGKWASKQYERILTLEKKAANAWSLKRVFQYEKTLTEIRPKAIFITHQRVASLLPICLAAKKLNIPVISCIYSWDNTPKASLAINADTYTVWSEYMKAELQLLHPELKEEQIVVTGTPQFEFYKDKSRYISRDEFALTYGLDASRKWICFSGDDEITSPYDPRYLEDVAKALMAFPEESRPQLIFRRAPVDVSGRYDKVLASYAEDIVSIAPIWTTDTKNWGAIYPKNADIDLLVNTAKHCDLVINLGSTMAHDFAMFDTPCLYVAYDVEEDTNWSVTTIYAFQHFRSMENLEAVGWVKAPSEWHHKITLALEDPKSIGPERVDWLKRIVNHPVTKASENIANLLLSK